MTRTCKTCGKSIAGLHPQCNPCREASCPHTETHYDGKYALVCACGKMMKVATKTSAYRVKKGTEPTTGRVINTGYSYQLV